MQYRAMSEKKVSKWNVRKGYHMNLLTIDHATKAYTDRMLLNDTDFSIQDGEKIGVIGINGTGKSTLLKIVAGLLELDEGTRSVGKKIKIQYLPQNPIFSKGSTILQAVLEGNITKLNEWSIEAEAKIILSKLGITDFVQEIQTLSGGQKKRVALANALLTSAEILILDEPTNHLDNQMTEWLEKYLQKRKGALIMVTHDRYFLDRVTNRIVEIDGGKLYRYEGGYSEYLRLKSIREDMQTASERKRQAVLKDELAWISRGARARSTKQKARIERYEQLRDQEGPQQEKQVALSSVSSRLGRKTIVLHEISKSFLNCPLFQNFTYTFLKDDRIGIVGKNGCGKSTLLKVITGLIPPDSGEVEIGQTVRIGYFSQENEALEEEKRVIDYIKDVAEYIETPDGKITAAMMLERFLFEGDSQWAPIHKLSGGEKRRLYLLRVLMEAPNVLILDESTNDLDIQTMRILEDYLENFAGIVITVSHDRYFLDRIAKRLFAFEKDGAIRQYEGEYSEHAQRIWEASEDSQQQDMESKKTSIKEKTQRVREKKLRFSYQEQKEFQTIDEEIAKLEEEIKITDEQIELSASDYGRLNSLMEQKQVLEETLNHKMERWMYLTELAEQIEQERMGT